MVVLLVCHLANIEDALCLAEGVHLQLVEHICFSAAESDYIDVIIITIFARK